MYVKKEPYFEFDVFNIFGKYHTDKRLSKNKRKIKSNTKMNNARKIKNKRLTNPPPML